MINQVFWDFDGTLFDTYPEMARAFKDGLMQLRIEDFEIDTNDIYKTMRQKSVGTTIQKFSAQFGINQASLKSIYEKLETEYINSSKPFDDVEMVLRLIVETGGHNYLLTHRDNQAKNLLDKYNLLGYFSGFVTKDNEFKRKPNPESLNYLINKYQVKRVNAVMIGDRGLDVEAGHNANIGGYLFDPDRTITGNVELEFRATKMKEIYEQIKNSAR